jgi:hypothetical protein
VHHSAWICHPRQYYSRTSVIGKLHTILLYYILKRKIMK